MKPLSVDHAAREAAANDLNATFFVEAAAGTGKTTSLVARILSIVCAKRARLTEIVGITFTEKAAGELKIRLREKIAKISSDDLRREALHDLEQSAISTIHSFCAAVLRERPIEAAVDPQFTVADELQKDWLLEEAWRKWLEQELTQEPPALRHALMHEIRLGDLCKLAKLLVEERSRWNDARWARARPLDARDLLAHLRAVAPALERGLEHIVNRGTNAYKNARALLEMLPSLEHAQPDRQVAVLSTLKLVGPNRTADFDSADSFREFKRILQEPRALLEEFAAVANHNLLVEVISWLEKFIAFFQQFKHQQATLDFDDLLLKTRDLLRDHAAVRNDLRRRFKFLLVDEFQDTDAVQTEIVFLLDEGRAGKLFVVGDPKQSIYSFRRADIERYAETRRTIEKRGRVVQFQQNFRSKSPILDWVNETFAHLIKKPLVGDYQPEYIPLTASPDLRSDLPAVTLLRPKKWQEGKADETRRAEARALARYLRQQITQKTFRYGDVAMLFRKFTAIAIYCDALREEDVPFCIVGGKDFYQRQEIATLMSLLCCLENPADKLNLIAVLRSPLFGWTDELIFQVSETGGLDYTHASSTEDELVHCTFALLRELHETRRKWSTAGFIEHVIQQAKMCEIFLACQPDGEQSVMNLLKAVDLARRTEALEGAGGSLRRFVRSLRETLLEEVQEEQSPAVEETDDVVRILTMHKAKGLEFPMVVLADLAGRSPDNRPKLLLHRTSGEFQLRALGRKTETFEAANDAQKLRNTAEEIRLLYVAATRAQQRLVVSWFEEKGGMVDLLRSGFDPNVASGVEVVIVSGEAEGESCQPATSGRHAKDLARTLIERRRAWEAERGRLLERAMKDKRPDSPSRRGGEPESFVEEEIVAAADGREIGTVVHEALEIVDWHASLAAQREQVERLVAESGLDDKKQRRARELVERALGSDLFKRVRAAETVEREMPFALVDPNNAMGLLEGRIDLLFCEKGKWVLVDYKTDLEVDETKYRAQFEAYVQALERVAKIKPAEKILFFLESGNLVKL